MARRLAFALVLLAAPASARAQGFDLQIFRPAPSTTGYLSQESGHVLPHLRFNVGIMLDGGRDLLVARNAATGQALPMGSIVETRIGGQLGLALGLGNRVEIGARIPMVLYQDGHPEIVDPSAELAGTVLGDVGAQVKAHVLGGARGFQLAFALDGTLPTGSPNDYAGGRTAFARPNVILGWDDEDVSAGFNFGYRLRGGDDVANLTVDDELTGGVGVGFTAVPHRTWILAELFVARGIQAHDAVRETPAELLVALRARLTGPWTATVGGGLGVSRGYGTPQFLGLAGFAYAPNLLPPPPPPPPPDRDGDRILDPVDKCPDDPEDKDGFEDEDGCPEDDNDGDGVPDDDDKCPRVPGPRENDGCPDIDSDVDGVPNRLDKCPEMREDLDGFEDDDGCPDDDNDKDGILDAFDKCPMIPEDKDGFEDSDGCPEPDNDKDGFLDEKDKCPNEPEIFNGIEDDDGCPDKGKELAKLTHEAVEIRDEVYFDTNKATIKKRSDRLLGAVAKILSLHPEIKKIRVEGHADSTGTHAHNLVLSQDRSESVRQHLIGKGGIDAGRLEAKGYGDERPVASNKSRKGRAANRRVQFIIVERE